MNVLILLSPSATAGPVPAFLQAEATRKQVGSLWFSTARFLLGATLLAAPLAFGAVETWAWASLTLLSLAILLLWAIGTVQRRILSLTWSPLYLPVLVFLGFGVIQYLAHCTLDLIGTRESLIKLLTDIIFFFLSGQLWTLGSDRTLLRFGRTVVVFAFWLGLFAILQFFTGANRIYWIVESPGYTFGPYVNHNHYAGLMEMLIPIAIAYILSRPENDPRRILLSFAASIPIVSLLLSGSRGGLIALVIEISILTIILLKYAGRQGRQSLSRIASLGVTAAALFFFWVAPFDISKCLPSLADFVQSTEATFGDRINIARDCIRIFPDAPWMGIGLGSLETVYPQYQSSPSDLVTDHAHNDYLEALVETGLVGGLLILTALITFFRLAFRNLRQQLKGEAAWIRLAAGLSCCGLLVHSFVDFNLHIPANAVWFAVCGAISTHASRPVVSQSGITSSANIPIRSSYAPWRIH